ncbi:MAG: hypothetical protein MUP20_05605 [Methyloceanibacter sp.]|nr:hypothetical protein [Methyloceanibacter sp.]
MLGENPPIGLAGRGAMPPMPPEGGVMGRAGAGVEGIAGLTAAAAMGLGAGAGALGALRLAVADLAAGLRAAVFRAGFLADLRAVLFLALVLVFLALVFLAVVLREPARFLVVLRALALRAVVFFAPARFRLLRAVVFLLVVRFFPLFFVAIGLLRSWSAAAPSVLTEALALITPSLVQA